MQLKAMGLCCAVACLSLCSMGTDVPRRVCELKSGPGNPRNSEGSFVDLKDGRIMFVFTRMNSTEGGDHGSADLAARYSSDGGETWTQECEIIVKNEGKRNVIEASLLRLQDGRIALFYLRDNSDFDERPYVRFSSDEGKTWTEPICCLAEPVGYYVLNNDRAVQLKSGRIVLPLARHCLAGDKAWNWNAELMCVLSDDGGATWRLSQSQFKVFDANGKRIIGQEPGVVEYKDGSRLLMFIRASGGCQYYSYSEDGGDTWSSPVASPLKSPVSPASMKRLPNGDLLCVWNNHECIPPSMEGHRSPLSTAISKDEGKSWQLAKNLEGNPNGWYCYTAIHVMEDSVLLGYCCRGLADTRITKVPISWLYEPAPEAPAQKNRFADLPLGDFTTLETPEGTWTAAENGARVHDESWGRGIWVSDKNKTQHAVELALADGKTLGDLNLAIERFSSTQPYTLVAEAWLDDQWTVVWAQDSSTEVHKHYPVLFAFPDKTPKRIRFRGIGLNGFIICDGGVNIAQTLNGFFND